MSRSDTHPQGLHDFDFLYGRWRVHNRRLRARLAGSDDWEAFEMDVRALPLMGGVGNLDENRAPDGRWVGLSFRLFDVAARRWNIYWARPTGLLQPPVVGAFEGTQGHFFGQEEHQGRLLPCRFTWSRVDTPQPHWEQALSPDGGRTWETNWTMLFSRAAKTDWNPFEAHL